MIRHLTNTSFRLHYLMPVLLSCIILILPPNWGIYYFLISLSLIYLILNHYHSDKLLFSILLVSYVIRLVFVLLDESLGLYSYELDSITFNRVAGDIIENIRNGSPVFNAVFASQTAKHYGLLISIFYYLLDYDQVIIRLLNSFIGVLTIAAFSKLALALTGRRRVSRIATIILACYPSFFLFSTLNLRDGIMVFLAIKMLSHFILAETKKNNQLQVLFFLAYFILNGLLRLQNFILISTVLIIYWSWKLWQKEQSTLLKTSFQLFLFLPFLLIVIFKWNFIVTLLQYPIIKMPLRATGGSAYLQNMVYSSWWDIFKFMPLRFIYFTFGPMLWDIRSAAMIPAMLEGWLIGLSFFFSYRFWKKNDSVPTHQIFFLILFGVIGLMANAIVDANYGTAIRHRMVYVIPFLLFASRYLADFAITFTISPKMTAHEHRH